MNNHLKIFSWLLLVLVLPGLTACSTSPAQPDDSLMTAQVGPEVISSPNDDRDYRYLVLANGLKVLLISDPKADKSAASLSVYRGNFDDPDDRPGLAHFLEHMLFIGTEKYPEPDGYFTYVQSHGGSSNAYTSSEHTNYFFDVQPDAFDEALDRFAQFFIAPLFQKEYVEREKNAVDSEYKLQIKDDGWRGFMVQKVTTNPEHPRSKFNIGTLDSLSGDVHGALLEFFETHYSADQMGLVVLSKEGLAELQPRVVELFSQVANRNAGNIERLAPVFAEGQLPATLRHNNIKDEYNVSYSFPVPATQYLYRSKPHAYLSNLLGHEGDGSLHKLLTEKGWISSLGAGASVIDERHSVMSISIDLTEAGAAHVPEITAYLFEYIEMLKSNPIEAWLYEEQATVAELGFRFAEKTSAIGTVSSISPNLEFYPAEELLVAPYLMQEFDEELIREFLAALRRDNVLVTIARPGYEGDSVEKWFDVSYDLERGPVATAAVEAASLSLPEPNPFMPESLALLPDDKALPSAHKSEADAEIFLDTDLEFRVPRAVTHVSLRNPGGLMTADDVARGRLYASLVQDNLNALAYPALLAGVSYQIASPPKGFRVSVGGYHDKQLVLMEEALERLVNLEIDPERFDVLKDELLRSIDNLSKERPYQQAYGRLQNVLIEGSWAADDMRPAVEAITVENLAAWRDEVLDSVSLQALLIGNVNDTRADELLALVERHVELEEVVVRDPRIEEVTGASTLGLDVDHNDAAMALFVQDDSSSFTDNAKSALLTHIIAPAFFSSLRTEQQLGYVVAAINTQLRERRGISFLIQSPVAGPDVLRDRSIAFMDQQAERLANMSEEEFGANKGGLITKLTQRDKNLAQRANRYWSDLDRGITSFDSRHQLAEAVSKLSLGEVQAFLDEVRAKLASRYLMIYSEGRFAEQ